MHFSIAARKNQQWLPEGSDPDQLYDLARKNAEDEGLGGLFRSIKILRKQARQVGIWQGKEIATRNPAYKSEAENHQFKFYSPGAVNDRFYPELDVRLDTGLKGNRTASAKPSLTDEEALALWDRLLGTIRLRQPSDATKGTE